MAKVELCLLLLAAACCLMMAPARAMYHIVGGSLGWSIPPNKTYFEEWAKPRVFGVHDKLVFPFRVLHNVVEVGKDDFEKCTQKQLINIYSYGGPVILNFTVPGDHFYYSGVGIQCELSQKLHITVVARKGSSGRIHSSANDVTAVPAPAPAYSAAAGSIGGWGGVPCLVSFVAWLFVMQGVQYLL